jgi:anti-sigma factor RsiW
MKLDHRWVAPRLSDYVDYELRPAQRRRVERHAAICPECGPALRGLLIVVQALRGLGRRPTRSVAPAVIDRLRHEDAATAPRLRLVGD